MVVSAYIQPNLHRCPTGDHIQFMPVSDIKRSQSIGIAGISPKRSTEIFCLYTDQSHMTE